MQGLRLLLDFGIKTWKYVNNNVTIRTKFLKPNWPFQSLVSISDQILLDVDYLVRAHGIWLYTSRVFWAHVQSGSLAVKLTHITADVLCHLWGEGLLTCLMFTASKRYYHIHNF